MASLLRGKRANFRTQSTVSGYLRQHDHCVSTADVQLIEYLITSFYWIEERFTLHGNELKLNESNLFAQGTQKSEQIGDFNTIYGNHVINTNDKSIIEYKWTLNYKVGGRDCIVIGIDSSNDRMPNDDFTGTHSTHLYYSVGTNGYTFCSKDSKYPTVGMFKPQGQMCLVLNLQLNTFKCSSNQDDSPEEWGTISDDVEFDGLEYNLAVAMTSFCENEIELVDFETIQK